MAFHNELGKAGEQAAKEFFIRKGYTIRESNWRCGKLELDLVVQKDGFVVFVEVKTRSSYDVDPTISITQAKIRNLINAGKSYLRMYKLPQLSMQIDYIFIAGTPGNFTLQHVENAVTPKFHPVRRR
ncbi:MAG: YraN family protein [Muribaculaceae bacterium]